jgi:hypothetical protein
MSHLDPASNLRSDDAPTRLTLQALASEAPGFDMAAAAQLLCIACGYLP